MNLDIYRYKGFRFKFEDEIPDTWNRLINDVDYYIANFLNSLHIDVDFLYTTNVGLLKCDNGSSKRILWDVSFWAMYLKYLEFIFWAEHEGDCSEIERRGEFDRKVVYTPSDLKYNALYNKNKLDANRLVFLPCIFEYLSYQFYNDTPASYMFALLRNENMCTMPHYASKTLLQEYEKYLSEQLLLAKLFCAGHEVYHLKILDPAGMDYEDYSKRVKHNLVTFVGTEEFAKMFADDLKLVADVRKTVSAFRIEDSLFDELYSDAASLDLMDVLINLCGDFNFTFEEFVKNTRITIENFYAFNTIIYDLYTIWKYNFQLESGTISEKVYKERVHIRDVESTIRGLIFPLILWTQLDKFAEERHIPPIPHKNRGLSVRYEMIQFHRMAYNDTIREKIHHTHKTGFKNGRLSIETARDILIGWDDLKKHPGAKTQDLFLGENDDENYFIMFARGY